SLVLERTGQQRGPRCPGPLIGRGIANWGSMHAHQPGHIRCRLEGHLLTSLWVHAAAGLRSEDVHVAGDALAHAAVGLLGADADEGVVVLAAAAVAAAR